MAKKTYHLVTVVQGGNGVEHSPWRSQEFHDAVSFADMVLRLFEAGAVFQAWSY